MTRLGFLAALAGLVGAAHGQEGTFLDVVITTADGDSVVEPGEDAIVNIYIDLDPDVGNGMLGFSHAVFDTIGGENADSGEVIAFQCLSDLCEGLVGDLTTTDGVNLFGTSLGQIPFFGPFTQDDPIAVFQFTWSTDDYSPRVVRYTTETTEMGFWDEDEMIVEADVVEADIAFCVGTCTNDLVPPDLPFGLEHVPFGSAGFDADDLGRLRLRGLGDDGNDGVQILLGDGSFHQLRYEATGVCPNAATIEIRSIGRVEGVEEKLFILEEATFDGGATGQYSFFSALEGSEAVVEVLLDGEVVLTGECGQCEPGEAMFSRTGFGTATVTPWRSVAPVTGVPSATLLLEFEAPEVISLPGGDVATGDAVRVRVLGFPFELVEATTMRTLSGAGVDAVVLIDEALGAFEHAHRALDGTALWAKGICPDCTLTLGNIGATGDDGVRLDIQPSVSAKVETSAIELQEARVVSYQLGVLEQDAIGLIVLASLEMDGSQEKLIEVTPDLAAIASPGAEVTATISSDGELVQAVSGPVENPPRLFVKGMAEHGVSCAFLPKVQISLTASTEGLVWIILDVQGNVLGEGDEIAYTVSEQAAEPNVVVGATMHVANGSGVTIFDELATPPATCFADCDGSGGLDILDFVCYQGLFTSGDPAADCDGNGVLNILDFVCFQGAFQTGCP